MIPRRNGQFARNTNTTTPVALAAAHVRAPHFIVLVFILL
jgi:hypothetical protein